MQVSISLNKSKKAKYPRGDISRKIVGIDRVISHVCVVKVFRGCFFNGVSLKKKIVWDSFLMCHRKNKQARKKMKQLIVHKVV